MSNPGTAIGPDATAAHPRGAWQAPNVYKTNDIVTNAGHTYRANQPTGPVAQAAPALSGTSAAFGGLANPLNVTIPATAAVGDLAIIVFQVYNTGTPLTTPAGWTLVGTISEAGSYLGVLTKTLIAGDPGAVLAITNNGQDSCALVRTYASPGADGAAVASNSGAPSAITTTTANDLIVACFGTQAGNGGAFTAGGTNQLTVAEPVRNLASVGMEDFAAPVAGVNAPAGGVYSNGATTVNQVTFAIKPGAAVFPLAAFDAWS